jgi:hypothetical protein
MIVTIMKNIGLHCPQKGKKETTLITPKGPKAQIGFFEILGRLLHCQKNL